MTFWELRKGGKRDQVVLGESEREERENNLFLESERKVRERR